MQLIKSNCVIGCCQRNVFIECNVTFITISAHSTQSQTNYLCCSNDWTVNEKMSVICVVMFSYIFYPVSAMFVFYIAVKIICVQVIECCIYLCMVHI